MFWFRSNQKLEKQKIYHCFNVQILENVLKSLLHYVKKKFQAIRFKFEVI